MAKITGATPAELATEMARVARGMKARIAELHSREANGGILHGLSSELQAWFPGLGCIDQLADMLSQTVVYVSFSSLLTPGNVPKRDGATDLAPGTSPFLKGIVKKLADVGFFTDEGAGPECTHSIDVVEPLDKSCAGLATNLGTPRSGDADRDNDLYQAFLKELDPVQKADRGVFYTPVPVADYVVRGVDYFLRDRLGVTRGLADAGSCGAAGIGGGGHRVQILDPATGTGAFLERVIEHVHAAFKRENATLHETDLTNAWSRYVTDHLVPRLFGFELLLAPLAIAHRKLGLALERTGFRSSTSPVLHLHLADTLGNGAAVTPCPDGPCDFVREEAAAVDAIKRDARITVILGNPPYKGHGGTRGREWIDGLVEDYRRIGGRSIDISQGKWLKNDYVRFIRFGEWRIDRSVEGVLALVTDNGFLTRSVFRGMRKHLIDTFDGIHVVNLHGNVKLHERGPRGERDENVFDITQGVCISFFVKSGKRGASRAVKYADLFGDRARKCELLARSTFPGIAGAEWLDLAPAAPMFLLAPRSEGEAEFRSGWDMSDIFVKKRTGFNSMHDEFAIAFTPGEMSRKIEDLIESDDEQAARRRFHLCTTGQWNYRAAKAGLSERNEDGEYSWVKRIVPCLYRPFDTRWTVYDKNVVPWRREEVNDRLSMNPLVAATGLPPDALETLALAIVTTRDVEVDEFNHVFITAHVAALHCVSVKETNHVFPMFRRDGGLNINPAFVADLARATGTRFLPDAPRGDIEKTFGAYDVVFYIYAILHSGHYRERYNDVLANSFPHVPLPARVAAFNALVGLGRDLVRLHLLVSGELDAGRVALSPGPNTVLPGYPRLDDGGRAWINRTQHFSPVLASAWDYHIGGARVLEGWLSDRRGVVLSEGDVRRFATIVDSVSRTLAVIDGIDRVLHDWPLSFERATSSGD